MTAILDQFQVVASARSTPVSKPEKVDAEHYAAFGRLWLQLEEAAEAVLAVEAQHARIDARLADPALSSRFPTGSPERIAAENRVITLGFERGRLMRDVRQLTLRIVRSWGSLPVHVQASITESAYEAIGPSPAMELLGGDQAVMGHTVIRRLVSEWHRGKGRPPANPDACPF